MPPCPLSAARCLCLLPAPAACRPVQLHCNSLLPPLPLQSTRPPLPAPAPPLTPLTCPLPPLPPAPPLQTLVDDDLVRQEKIGVSNFFWSFPSEAAVKLDTEAGKLQTRHRARRAEEAQLRQDLDKSNEGKEDTVREIIYIELFNDCALLLCG